MTNQQSLPRQLEFNFGFVRASILLALTAGFAIAAHLSFTIGFDFQMSKGFYAFIQIHGHTQLLGWLGLMIIGISLHFIPRLTHSPIGNPSILKRILFLLTTGLALRILAGSVLPYLQSGTAGYFITSIFIALSALFELAGILLYLYTLISIIKKSIKLSDAFNDVKPFLFVMVSGFLLYGLLNTLLIMLMIFTGDSVLDQNWNEILTRLFLSLIVLPITFIFSIRLFPLLFSVEPMKKVSVYLGLSYGISVFVDIVLSSVGLLGIDSQLTNFLLTLSGFLIPSLIIYLILSLKILKLPLINRLPTEILSVAERWSYISIRVAYLWLLLSSILELTSHFQMVLGYDVVAGTDAIKHIQLLGFASMLVFGVGSKMLPGFIGRREIYSGKLVVAAFWLLLLSAIFRVTPVLLPYAVVEIIPYGEQLMGAMFALSGILGMIAIAAFGWNLRKTNLFQS
ncbi:MAG: hypothetical protein IIB39_01530 [Candidatus Marinimicrobia bacterium]|nr:hypothetical protein [Candidatus Neomarinimicrobiota bacterium]